MRKFYTNINIVLRHFSKDSPDMNCTLFKAFCSNMYCSTLWYNCTVTAMKRLRIAYSNSLRRLLGIPKHNSASEKFVQLNIKSFGELMQNNMFNFMNRLQCSSYLILTSLCKSTVPLIIIIRRIFIHTPSIPRKNTTYNSYDDKLIYTYYEA